MAQYLAKLLLDDSVPAQATLIGQILAQLSSIASNQLASTVNPALVGIASNIDVRRVA